MEKPNWETEEEQQQPQAEQSRGRRRNRRRTAAAEEEEAATTDTAFSSPATTAPGGRGRPGRARPGRGWLSPPPRHHPGKVAEKASEAGAGAKRRCRASASPPLSCLRGGTTYRAFVTLKGGPANHSEVPSPTPAVQSCRFLFGLGVGGASAILRSLP